MQKEIWAGGWSCLLTAFRSLGGTKWRTDVTGASTTQTLLILPRVLARVGRTPVDKLLTALNRCGVNIFLSTRNGNAAKNMPLFTPRNPEESSGLIQVRPCLLPSLPCEPEHRGVSCVHISPTLVESVFLLPSQCTYWPGLRTSWVEGEKGKLQQLTGEKLSGTLVSNLGSGLPILKVQTHGRHQELLISAAALTEGTFPK